jgi:hypothetical protein
MDVTSAQFTLAWNPAVLRFSDVGNFGLSGLTAGSFGLARKAEGKLAFSWNDSGAAGMTLADGTAIFEVSFEVTGAPGSVSALSLTDVPTLREASVNLAGAAITAEEGKLRVVGIVAGPWISEPVYRQGAFEVSVRTEAGRRYVLEFTDRLPAAQWTALPAVEGDGQAMRLTDSGATDQQRFYRVRVE